MLIERLAVFPRRAPAAALGGRRLGSVLIPENQSCTAFAIFCPKYGDHLDGLKVEASFGDAWPLAREELKRLCRDTAVTSQVACRANELFTSLCRFRSLFASLAYLMRRSKRSSLAYGFDISRHCHG